MSLFEASPALLKSSAEEVEEIRTTDADTIRWLRIIVLGLSDSWKGEAQDAFVAKFLSMGGKFKQFDAVLQQYGELLSAVAESAETVDSDLLTAVRGME